MPKKSPLQPVLGVTTKKILAQPNQAHSLADYLRVLKEIDRDRPQDKEYGSILILSLVEEVGEIARAYLAEHGRKPSNKLAQRDESYQQELGDLLISIFRLAIEKNINLDHRIQYTLKKLMRRRIHPKGE